MRLFRAILAALALSLCHGNVQANDFVSDLASCAVAPIEAAGQTVGSAPKVIEFTVNHSECMPKVVSVSPILVGMTSGVVGLQQANFLPVGDAQCSNALLGPAQRKVANMVNLAIDTVPFLSSFIPNEARTMLVEIANNQGTASLYQVPGISMVVEDMSCGCAISATGMGVEELAAASKTLLKGVKGCESVVGSLLGGGYELGKSATSAVASSAVAVYDSIVNAGRAVSCAMGLGGCPKKGPPFFCTGYQAMRAQGADAENLSKIFGSGTFGAGNQATQNNFAYCEADYQAKIEAEIQRQQEKAEARRLKRELEQAQQTASIYALRYAFDWIPKCRKDQICEASISNIADQFGAELVEPETINDFKTYGAAIEGLNKKYSIYANVAVAVALDKLYANWRESPTATAAQKMEAYGCRNFLGREGQYLCKSAESLGACKNLAKAGRVEVCASPNSQGSFYANDQGLSRQMRSIGCIPLDGSGLGQAPTPNAAVFSRGNLGHPITSAPAPSGQSRSQPDPATQRRERQNQLAVNLLGALVQSAQVKAKDQQLKVLTPLAVSCLSSASANRCEAYMRGGSLVACGSPRSIVLSGPVLESALAPVNWETSPPLIRDLPPTPMASQLRNSSVLIRGRTMQRTLPPAATQPQTAPQTAPPALPKTLPRITRPRG